MPAHPVHACIQASLPYHPRAMGVESKSIKQMFAELKAKKQLAFMPFISAGYPDLEVTKVILPALEKAGASFIEVGLPFSDPIADGPTIQESYTAALSKKIKVSDCLNAVAQARSSVSIPMIAMVSFTIVYRFGLEKFIQAAKDAGINGLILPDLPPPEADAICAKVNAAGIDTILLVAPSTTPERRKKIAELSTGFVYYLSVAGITGERTSLPADIERNLAELKSLTDRPICVGFGISTPEHLKQLEGKADGAIVGSAIVKRMKQHASEGAASITKNVSEYCRDLLKLVR